MDGEEGMRAEDPDDPATVIVEAASTAAEATAAAIEQASDANRDPVVAEALDEAAVHAETTVGRVGWLRAFVRRLYGRR